MHSKVIITCAVTGNITTRDQHPDLPVTPEEIAEASLLAAEEGASVVHIHVRDPVTGDPSMELDYYRQTVDLIRAKNPALILNLTTGPGGRFAPSDEDPSVAGPGTTLVRPELRVEHISVLKPEICTLDLNTMNSGGQVVINTPRNVTVMARAIRAAGVKPELELFDSGDLHLARHLIDAGELDGPGLFSFVLGVNYGFNATPETMMYARNLLPPGAVWTGFGVGRSEFAMVAQSWLLGGHVRVGLEDNIYMSKGVLAPSNAALVQRARQILAGVGAEPANPSEARRLLGLS
ncbi:MAG: 3-keto-5-aminohexanoate cleavage protein [Pseudomonadota bacterium]|uniref:3-keto-5-aminohexanoate cleavage protein n=1 Tax=unclassified Phenylobacterium TaxID=2640670 RepID=UPI0006FED148|nr:MULTISPECIES: 3-keto-5-aminohexanoate cleavage protein [unclassified Phenylobacterium]KRB48992.1 NADPH:quinone reductase [Phenylobacterium sp. Root700]MBT9473886.1 3-keto-5-aminohexanoate cleavage protein [Phenylobacterium sp.]